MRKRHAGLRPTEVHVEAGRNLRMPRLRIRGELDAASAPLLREAAGDVSRLPCVAIDLSGLDFIDSAGLGALIGGLRVIREAGGRAALVAPVPSVGRVIRTAGFDRIVPVVADFEEAAEALAPPEDASQ